MGCACVAKKGVLQISPELKNSNNQLMKTEKVEPNIDNKSPEEEDKINDNLKEKNSIKKKDMNNNPNIKIANNSINKEKNSSTKLIEIISNAHSNKHKNNSYYKHSSKRLTDTNLISSIQNGKEPFGTSVNSENAAG